MDRALLRRVLTVVVLILLVGALFGVFGPWQWHPGTLSVPGLLLVVLILVLVL